MMSKIFISHRSTDKAIADMLLDFFIATNIPREEVFCSSLPGNDVKERISKEVKDGLKESIVDIAILSDDYYKSTYCVNEAGILWFKDVTVFAIALPEIVPENMIGFLNDEFRIRRLDNSDDIAAIYDQIFKALSITQVSATILTREIKKLKDRYSEHLGKRLPISQQRKSYDFNCVTTDDERIVLFYLLSHKIRKVNMNTIKGWLVEEELYDVNIENAFDLLSTLGNSTGSDDTIELDIDIFRKISADSERLLETMKQSVESHCHLSRLKFKSMWGAGDFDDEDILFIAYTIDEKVSTFGDRWMAESQIEDIKSWEKKYSLQSSLSNDYGKCLSKFIENHLVFESSWTSYGNPRAYILHKSLKEFLFHKDFPYKTCLDTAKQNIHFELPF